MKRGFGGNSGRGGRGGYGHNNSGGSGEWNKRPRTSDGQGDDVYTPAATRGRGMGGRGRGRGFLAGGQPPRSLSAPMVDEDFRAMEPVERPVTPETSEAGRATQEQHHAEGDEERPYEEGAAGEEEEEEEELAELGADIDDAETAEEKRRMKAEANAGGEPVSKFRVSAGNVAQLAKRGIERFFKIQSESYDHIYDGKDVVGRAETGSGKTLSFVLPVMEKLIAESKTDAAWKRERARLPRVLCIAPTRELARQNAEEFVHCSKHEGFRTVLVYGGALINAQVRELWEGADVVVGTPGRIIDLMDRGDLVLDNLRVTILDEADEMLSFGFAEAVEKILARAPTGDKKPQTLLFSATLPKWVRELMTKFLAPDYVTVDLVGAGNAARKCPKSVKHFAMSCPYSERGAVLRDMLLLTKCDLVADGEEAKPCPVPKEVADMYGTGQGRTIVFTATKHEADSLYGSLSAAGLDCKAIHGDVAQAQRDITLQNFRKGKFSILIATDVAARGLDISGVDRVVMCSVPKDAESYIHRSGRTGRAGQGGLSIVMYSRDNLPMLARIERKAGFKFVRIGVPQCSSLIRTMVDTTLKTLHDVSESTVALFKTDAAAFIAKVGDPVEALARALALIVKVPEQDQMHALLSGNPGFVTLFMHTDRPFAYSGQAFHTLVRLTGATDGIRDTTLVDGGALFDAEIPLAKRLLALKQTNGLSFTRVLKLPEGMGIPTEEAGRAPGASAGGNRGGSRGGFGNNRSGYGGGNRGYGGGNGGANRGYGGGNRGYGGGAGGNRGNGNNNGGGRRY